jgi:hypothetical protein
MWLNWVKAVKGFEVDLPKSCSIPGLWQGLLPERHRCCHNLILLAKVGRFGPDNSAVFAEQAADQMGPQAEGSAIGLAIGAEV